MDCERFIPEINELNLNISPEAIDYLGKIMGDDLWRPVNRQQLLNAKEWINSPVKRKVEKIFAIIIAAAGGKYFVEWARGEVRKIDGEDGYYKWEMGFLGDDFGGDYRIKAFKIRSMRVGAEHELDSPFRHKSFSPIVNDERVLDRPLVKFMRRTGLDSLTDIVYGVTSGDWNLISPRPYTSHELEGTEILWKLRWNLQVSLSHETRSMLEKYPMVVKFFKPRPGIFGPLACFREQVNHTTRMAGDLAYWEHADPFVDFRIFAGGIKNRIIRGVGSE